MHCKCMLGSVMDPHSSDVAHSCGESFAGVLSVRAAIRRTKAMLDAVYGLEHDQFNCYYQWLNK